MKRNDILKILSVLLAFLLTLNIFSSNLFVCASESLTSEEEKIVLEQKLKQLDKRLSYLKDNSDSAKEYVDTLTVKLDNLKNQYAIIEKDCESIEASVKNTQNRIEYNQKEILDSNRQLAELDRAMLTLNEDFENIYALYSKRLRAMYVSSSNNTYLMFLLDSKGIENFLVRLEMFKRVTASDSMLLDKINSQMDSIIEAKNDIEKQSKRLKANKEKLENNKLSLKKQRALLFTSEEKLKNQKLSIENEQIIANKALKKLNDKTQKYGEYRDITESELAEIDGQIAKGDEKYQDPVPSTQAPSDSEDLTTTTKKEEYIKLTFPCPSYTEITCAFGEYKGHSGCDFSTRSKENQKIVAAESGTVILVKLLEKSYGHYVVIRHDKTTSDGQTVYTLYAHNNDIIVSEGDYVQKGQQIAYSGTTGNSTGPHCHFEVRVGGSSQAYAKNPEKYLPTGSG